VGFYQEVTFYNRKQADSVNYGLMSINIKNADTAVLDGQQRLTSLFLSLLGNAYIRKKHARRNNKGGLVIKLQIKLNKNKLTVDEEEYNSKNYDWYRHNDYSMTPEKYLKPIAHPVYYDYCANGMMNDDVCSYGTNSHERPEFMMKLSGAFRDLKKMEDEWAERNKSYKVNFHAIIDQIHRFNFDLNETQEGLTDDEIEQIRRC